MQTQSLPYVTTILFDPVHPNRHATRNALFSLGFRELEAATTIADLRKSLEGGTYDICFVEVTADEAEVCRFIHDLRHGKAGANPFMITMATTWRQSGDLVRKVIASGADDLLIRPLSAGVLKLRLQLQIENRKRFVVTSNYIGPDRRRTTGREVDENLIDVPNSLRTKVKDGNLSGPDSAVIAEARQRVERLRLEKNAFYIATACQMLQDHIAAPQERYDLESELNGLVQVTDDLKERTAAGDFAVVAPICGEIGATVAELNKILRANARSPGATEPISHLMQRAISVIGTLNPQKGEAVLKTEIGETVAKLRARPVPIAGRSGAKALTQ